MTDKIIESPPRRDRSKKFSASDLSAKPRRGRKRSPYKDDGREKIFALDIGTRSVIVKP